MSDIVNSVCGHTDDVRVQCIRCEYVPEQEGHGIITEHVEVMNDDGRVMGGMLFMCPLHNTHTAMTCRQCRGEAS